MSLRGFWFSVDDDFSSVVLEVGDLRVSLALSLQPFLQGLEILHGLLFSQSRPFLLFKDGSISKLLALISFHLILANKPGLLNFFLKIQGNFFP